MRIWAGLAVWVVSWSSVTFAQDAKVRDVKEPVLEQPAAESPTPATPPPAEAQKPTSQATLDQNNELRPIGAESIRPQRIKIFGYLKLGYFAVLPATNDDALVGAHNGFRLANLRMGLAFQPVEHIGLVASIDGAVARRDEMDPLTGNRIVELRDAYLEWTKLDWLSLRGGQFKAPYNGEFLQGDGAVPFVTRSIVTDGLLPPEGFPQEGMSLGRQLGITAFSSRLGHGLLGFRYNLALVNGNGINVLNNDNNAITPVGRLVLEVGEHLSFGVNGYYDVQTSGNRPGRLTDNRAGAGADVFVSLGSFQILGVGLWRATSHPSTGLPAENGIGAVASVAYVNRPTGIEAGIRYAFLEPSDLQAGDQLMEAAAMVGYRATFFPGRVILQYTLRMEEQARTVNNNSLDAMIQLSF
jgi:hypothetical protein